MTFIPFTRVSDSRSLIELFKAQLAEGRKPTHQKLLMILNDYSQLSVKMFKCSNFSDLYMVMIVGRQDSILVKLGRLHNFPRGFPILWRVDKDIRFYGFYPKFENDDHTDVTPTSLDNVTNIEITKKWSGFLGQVCPFSYEGSNYWTVCSKNSAEYTDAVDDDSEPESQYFFTREIKRLFEKHITPKNLDILITNRLHICAEVMSKKDQVHGARLLMETPIITAIGSEASDKFVEFVDTDAMLELCKGMHLPFARQYKIAGNTNISKFIGAINSHRDYMTDSRMDAILRTYCPLEGIRSEDQSTSEIFHSMVLGEVLEGIVVKFYTKTSSFRLKFKFPYYTCRTMLLRDFAKTAIPELPLTNITNFCNRWCLLSEGKKYFIDKLKTASTTYARISAPNSIFSPLVTDLKIGKHIVMADIMFENFAPDTQAFYDSADAAESDAVVATAAAAEEYVDLIVVLGPIGSGKSTVGELLSKMIPNSKHIDGDILGLTKRDVLRLGQERNMYTQWKIIEAIMEHKVPIISTGGGALCSFKQQPEIFDLVRKMLNIRVHLHLFTPDSTISNIAMIDQDDTRYRDEYSNPKYDVGAVIRHRLTVGDWTLPKGATVDSFVQKITRLSADNQVFVEMFSELAARRYAFPRIRKDTNVRKIKVELGYTFKTATASVLKAKIMQHRILVEYPTGFGHITVKYDASRSTEMTLQDIQIADLPVEVDGSLFDYGTCSFIRVQPLDRIVEGCHVTVNPGKHEPKYMGTLARMNFGSTVTIPTKLNNSTCTYTYDRSTKQSSISVYIHGYFAS